MRMPLSVQFILNDNLEQKGAERDGLVFQQDESLVVSGSCFQSFIKKLCSVRA